VTGRVRVSVSYLLTMGNETLLNHLGAGIDVVDSLVKSLLLVEVEV
jgi:hypothetical protein